MQISPTGGLSIFINLAIVIVGYIFQQAKKISFLRPPMLFVYSIITGKKHDHFFRRFLGYGVAASIFLSVFVSTSFSIYNRLTNESNYDLIANAVHQIIKTDDSVLEEKDVKKPATPRVIDLKHVAQADYFSSLFSNVYTMK
jgi:hypothetical protein